MGVKGRSWSAIGGGTEKVEQWKEKEEMEWRSH